MFLLLVAFLLVATCGPTTVYGIEPDPTISPTQTPERDGITGWLLDSDPELLKLAASPCDLRRVPITDLLENGRIVKFPIEFEKPVIITGVGSAMTDDGKPVCDEACFATWHRSSFLDRFGHFQIGTSPEIDIGANGSPVLRGGPSETLSTAILRSEEDISYVDKHKNQLMSFDAGQLFEDILALSPELSWPELFVSYNKLQIVSFAGSRIGLPFHKHPAAYMWVVQGRKKWFFLPPEGSMGGIKTYMTDLLPLQESFNKSTLTWLLERSERSEGQGQGRTNFPALPDYPHRQPLSSPYRHQHERGILSSDLPEHDTAVEGLSKPNFGLLPPLNNEPVGLYKHMLQCTQEAGEVMFIPPFWNHATLNVGTTLGFGGQAAYNGRETHKRQPLHQGAHKIDL